MTGAYTSSRRLWVFFFTIPLPLLAAIAVGTIWMLRLRDNPEFPLFITGLSLTAACVGVVATIAGIGFQVITSKAQDLTEQQRRSNSPSPDLRHRRERFDRLRKDTRRILLLLVPLCVLALVVVVGADQIKAINGVVIQDSVRIDPSTLAQSGTPALVTITPPAPLRTTLELTPDISITQGEDCRGAATLDLQVKSGDTNGDSRNNVLPGQQVQLSLTSGSTSTQIAVRVHFQDANCIGQLTVTNTRTKGE